MQINHPDTASSCHLLCQSGYEWRNEAHCAVVSTFSRTRQPPSSYDPQQLSLLLTCPNHSRSGPFQTYHKILPVWQGEDNSQWHPCTRLVEHSSHKGSRKNPDWCSWKSLAEDHLEQLCGNRKICAARWKRKTEIGGDNWDFVWNRFK